MVDDKSPEEYLSTDKAPAFDTPNDDLVSLGSELSDIQATDMVVQLRNLIATNDNAHCTSLSNVLDYIDEARLKAIRLLPHVILSS